MARTITPEQPVIKSCRQVPVDYNMETRCHWKCPCGGTVPDAPESCKWRQYSNKAATYCTSVGLCISVCPERPMCRAFINFRTMIKKRHQQDILNMPEKRKGDDNETD